ncbi:MAG TPA: ATP-binding protein [Conexibacter sp.]|nr:ATP-binding protein [Conexibacter sp.]
MTSSADQARAASRPHDGWDAHVELAATVEAPALARAAVEAALDAHAQRDATLLAASELVTNAVRYGSTAATDTIELNIKRDDDSVRIEVVNAGAAFAVQDREQHDPPGLGGWGLDIVAGLSRDWGIEHNASRTAVWFVL